MNESKTVRRTLVELPSLQLGIQLHRSDCGCGWVRILVLSDEKVVEGVSGNDVSVLRVSILGSDVDKVHVLDITEFSKLLLGVFCQRG